MEHDDKHHPTQHSGVCDRSQGISGDTRTGNKEIVPGCGKEMRGTSIRSIRDENTDGSVKSALDEPFLCNKYGYDSMESSARSSQGLESSIYRSTASFANQSSRSRSWFSRAFPKSRTPKTKYKDFEPEVLIAIWDDSSRRYDKYLALIDTGASNSLITDAVVTNQHIPLLSTCKEVFEGPDGDRYEVCALVKPRWKYLSRGSIVRRFGKIQNKLELRVVKRLPSDIAVILGQDFIKATQCIKFDESRLISPLFAKIALTFYKQPSQDPQGLLCHISSCCHQVIPNTSHA